MIHQFLTNSSFLQSIINLVTLSQKHRNYILKFQFHYLINKVHILRKIFYNWYGSITRTSAVTSFGDAISRLAMINEHLAKIFTIRCKKLTTTVSDRKYLFSLDEGSCYVVLTRNNCYKFFFCFCFCFLSNGIYLQSVH